MHSISHEDVKYAIRSLFPVELGNVKSVLFEAGSITLTVFNSDKASTREYEYKINPPEPEKTVPDPVITYEFDDDDEGVFDDGSVPG